MANKLSKVLIFLIPLLVITLIFPFANPAPFQEQTSPSTATVNVFVEITLGGFGGGIAFGSLDPNTNDNQAPGTFTVTAGAANNVNIDTCIKDNAALTKAGPPVYTIPNTGYTYEFTAGTPSLPGVAITTNYFKTQHTNLAPSVVSNAGFWLDVPLGQSAGSYNNTVYIKGIETGQAC
jgi:hypothetical protein